MKKQILNEEFLRMQKLAGLITENQLNEEEISPEKAVPIAKNVANKVKNTPEFNKVVDAISKDPKAQTELMKLMGLNESEGITKDIVDRLALHFAKKAEQNPEKLNEESDYGGPFFVGLFGGQILARYIASLGDVITPQMELLGHSPAHMGAAIAGAVAGAVLAMIGVAVYDKIKKN